MDYEKYGIVECFTPSEPLVAMLWGVFFVLVGVMYYTYKKFYFED